MQNQVFCVGSFSPNRTLNAFPFLTSELEHESSILTFLNLLVALKIGSKSHIKEIDEKY